MNTTNTQPKAENAPAEVSNSVVKISPEYKLEKVASKPGGSRPSLENIKLGHNKRFGHCAIATQGRSMAIVPVEMVQGDNDGGLLSVEALKASRKNGTLSGQLILNGKIEVPYGAAFVRPDESEFRYPAWEKVLPEYPIKFEIGVNVKLLAELCEALGAKDEIVRLSFSDEMSPVVVTRSGGRTKGEYGVLMPGRLS